MPEKKYTVLLSPTQEALLKAMIHTGKDHSAREILHAQVLLHSNDNKPESKKDNRELAAWLGVSPTTVNQIRKTFSQSGLDAAISRKTRIMPPVASKITGDFEAKVIATALTPPPDGHCAWTLRLLAEYCVENNYIVSISHSAIGELLNTNELKPHLNKYWCIPKHHDAAFVANMEDILGIYQLPYNKDIPVICMDEKPVQLLSDIYEHMTAKSLTIDPETKIISHGCCEKIDYKYDRNGTASIFMFTEPLAGWRCTTALPTRKKGDFAIMMRQLAEEHYPDRKRIIIVSDNLNTHTKTAFYEAFPPAIAYDLSQKFEFHHTPKHGSWLNIAETELSALTVQCLGKRRIDNIDLLNYEIVNWARERNRKQIGVNWQFTTEDARIKLKRLYPKPLFEK